MAATIHFAGFWSGVLILEVSQALACQFTAHFLSAEPPQAVDDDVRDVLGEIANMIGGNLKSAMAPGASLSLPEVIGADNVSLRISGGTSSKIQDFLCHESVFRVSLIEMPQ